MNAAPRFGLSLAASVYYDVLARVDLGADAASIYSGVDAPWSARIAAMYPSGDRADRVQVLPLLTPNLASLLAALRSLGPFEDALAAVLADHAPDFEARWNAERAGYETQLDRAAVALEAPLAAARTALWRRADRTPPPALVLDARALGAHGRGTAIDGRQIVATSFARADEDLFCTILHEETHAVSDAAVRREHPGVVRATARGNAGHALHRALEDAALRLADEVVREAVPELAGYHARWIARYR